MIPSLCKLCESCEGLAGECCSVVSGGGAAQKKNKTTKEIKTIKETTPPAKQAKRCDDRQITVLGLIVCGYSVLYVL